MAMKRAWKKKWVDALRSGKYRQTKGQLRRRSKINPHNFCCLGVLCDLVAQEGHGSWTRDNDFKIANQLEDEALPYGVVELVGLSSQNPIVGFGTTLAELNDTGKSFAEIADIIEKQL